MIENLISFLVENDINFKQNVLMKNLTSIKIGGIAAILILPNTPQKAIAVIDFLTKIEFPYKIIGRMTNILPCDSYYFGALVSTRALSKFDINKNYVICDSGAFFSSVLRKIREYGLGGAEALMHIPGSIGGMIYSNASAFGKSISDFFVNARIYSPNDKKEHILNKDALSFEYRHSSLCGTNNFLVSASFHFQNIDADISIALENKYRELRNSSQPTSSPSLGSIFKKSNSISAGQLIDNCGLKGTRYGGAVISQKHAGFIVNENNATASDVRELIKIVESTVYRKYGIKLEREIEFL